jgi:hypothetical protein
MLVGPRPGEGEEESQWGGIMTLNGTNALVMFDNGGCKTRRISLLRVGEL